MARIATNTTGTQPVILITNTLVANTASPTGQFTPTFGVAGANINIPFVQDVTVTNSTGVYSYTTFSDTDTRKVSTPADNEISFNVVVDDLAFYGNAGATANTAANFGLQYLAANKIPVGIRIYSAGFSGSIANTTARYREAVGFITSLAPTVSPDAPVWVTPMTLAVDASYRDGSGTGA